MAISATTRDERSHLWRRLPVPAGVFPEALQQVGANSSPSRSQAAENSGCEGDEKSEARMPVMPITYQQFAKRVLRG